MTPKDKKLFLVRIYLYVCDNYDTKLAPHCQRFSNNFAPSFTDQELMAIYLYGVGIERRFKVKEIYEFTKCHLSSWFPQLPTYAAFVMRLNRMAGAFSALCSLLLTESLPHKEVVNKLGLLDSMPIITCSGKRSAKVALDIADKGYCSTKSMFYYGVKLHVLALATPGTVPHPVSMLLSEASENDLTVFKENWADIPNFSFVGDKIYQNRAFFEQLAATANSQMLTPVKSVKCKPEALVAYDAAWEKLYSRAVSKIRQPIESLFNWLIEHTDIQRASKIRSTAGLLIHVFGKVAAAFIKFIC